MTPLPVRLPIRLYLCSNDSGSYLVSGFYVGETERTIQLASTILDGEVGKEQRTTEGCAPDFSIEKSGIVKEIVLAA